MLSCKTLFRNKLDANKEKLSHTKFDTFRQNSNRNPKTDRIHINIFNSTKNDLNDIISLSKHITPSSSIKQQIFPCPTRTANSSTIESSLNLYKIRKPNTIAIPIKEKIKRIKNRRQIFIENYYTESLKSSSAFKNSNLYSNDGTIALAMSSYHSRENSEKIHKTSNHII